MTTQTRPAAFSRYCDEHHDLLNRRNVLVGKLQDRERETYRHLTGREAAIAFEDYNQTREALGKLNARIAFVEAALTALIP